MADKIHCGNCGMANKPSCYSNCPIKRGNDLERTARQNACKPNPIYIAIAEQFNDWCRTNYYKKGRI